MFKAKINNLKYGTASRRIKLADDNFISTGQSNSKLEQNTNDADQKSCCLNVFHSNAESFNDSQTKQSNRLLSTDLNNKKATNNHQGNHYNGVCQTEKNLLSIYEIAELDFAELDETSGKLTLWQFLLELLLSNKYQNIIRWTNKRGEFILLQAEVVSRLWGLRKDKNHRMNYDKLSRALRYYYQKNILRKVHGRKFVYQFIGLKNLLKFCRPSSMLTTWSSLETDSSNAAIDNCDVELLTVCATDDNASSDNADAKHNDNTDCVVAGIKQDYECESKVAFFNSLNKFDSNNNVSQHNSLLMNTSQNSDESTNHNFDSLNHIDLLFGMHDNWAHVFNDCSKCFVTQQSTNSTSSQLTITTTSTSTTVNSTPHDCHHRCVTTSEHSNNCARCDSKCPIETDQLGQIPNLFDLNQLKWAPHLLASLAMNLFVKNMCHKNAANNCSSFNHNDPNQSNKPTINHLFDSCLTPVCQMSNLFPGQSFLPFDLFQNLLQKTPTTNNNFSRSTTANLSHDMNQNVGLDLIQNAFNRSTTPNCKCSCHNSSTSMHHCPNLVLPFANHKPTSIDVQNQSMNQNYSCDGASNNNVFEFWNKLQHNVINSKDLNKLEMATSTSENVRPSINYSSHKKLSHNFLPNNMTGALTNQEELNNQFVWMPVPVAMIQSWLDLFMPVSVSNNSPIDINR